MQKRSFLCVGLDTNTELLPQHLRGLPNAVVAFNKAVIEATHQYCVSYKINTAFYEAQGPEGWEALQQTRELVPDTHLCIADAKRGDIGNTSGQYAEAFFGKMNFDAITAVPYMGQDSVQPFLDWADHKTILLALTSNPGSADFQQLQAGQFPLYEQVLRQAKEWGKPEQLLFVVGATQAQHLQRIREIVPEHFLLIPGVGAQGGSLEAVARFGMNNRCGLLVNASRSIIYASDKEDFALAAENEAKNLQEQMAKLLEQYLMRGAN
jgi:orotidine-5'-phosphate decarboxylase